MSEPAPAPESTPAPDTEPALDPGDVDEARHQADAEFEQTSDEIDEQVKSITEKVNEVLDRDEPSAP